MKDINNIIQCIDTYLDRTGQEECTPREANEELERNGILNDRSSRPGLPLRKLLRDGLIPHAYQTCNKRWHIPKSTKK